LVLTSAPEPSDQVVEEEDARVFLEAPVAAALEDKVLDARLEDTGVRFYVLSESPS
jgi:iron-sulfur cluster assembly protein